MAGLSPRGARVRFTKGVPAEGSSLGKSQLAAEAGEMNRQRCSACSLSAIWCMCRHGVGMSCLAYHMHESRPMNHNKADLRAPNHCQPHR